MLPLTIQMLISNNRSTIEATLNSLAHLNAQIIVGDTGSQDGTRIVCEAFGCQIVHMPNNNDRSVSRNVLVDLAAHEWQMLIEPWEILINSDALTSLSSDKNKHIEVVQGGIITKPIRLWKSSKFVQPIYENIPGDSEFLPVVIWSEEPPAIDRKLIDNWKKSHPLANEPYYYKAFASLADKNYKEFLNLAEHYLFKEPGLGISATMTRYYMAIVHNLIANNQDEAHKLAILCLAVNPLMAEFWCLLGDISLKLKDFEEAKSFYENAKIMGSRRLRGDKWPMHISKYEEYPDEMLAILR